MPCTTRPARHLLHPSCAGALVLALAAAPASAQPTSRAAFVANNGNLEGSVTSFLVNDDGTLAFVQKLITGSRPNSQVYHPGTNAYSISLSADGAFLAVGHTTSSETVEQLTILRVHPDATLEIAGVFQTPDSPLDVQWIDDRTLAATSTAVSGMNRVFVYRFDPGEGGGTPGLAQIDVENTGGFTTGIALHPTEPLLYTQDSTNDTVTAFRVNEDRTLTRIDAYETGGVFPLGPGITPDGEYLYAGGGISAGGHAVVGFAIDQPSGALSLLPDSPFFSPGTSPKLAVASTDGDYLFVGHGTDATVRSFAIDPKTGGLTVTGFSFDVGIQGSLGDVAPLDNFLLVTDRDTIIDGVRGLYSFTVNPDGSLAQNGPLVDSQGISPNTIAAWPLGDPGCAADWNNDATVNSDDFFLFLEDFFGEGGADFNGDGATNSDDYFAFLDAFFEGC